MYIHIFIYVYYSYKTKYFISCYFTINLCKNLFCFRIRKTLNTFVREEKVIFPTALLGFLTGVL